MLASLIRRAIEKFNFKRSQLEGRENFIFRTFLEVTNRLPQIYLRLVIICFKLRSLSMATLKTLFSLLVRKETSLVRTQKQIIFSFQRDSFRESYKSVRLLLHQKVSC